MAFDLHSLVFFVWICQNGEPQSFWNDDSIIECHQSITPAQLTYLSKEVFDVWQVQECNYLRQHSQLLVSLHRRTQGTETMKSFVSIL